MKRYEFLIDSTLYNKAMSPIRNRRYLIELLIDAVKMILVAPKQQGKGIPDNKKLIIYIDKMSRLVFSVENKIFSFNFPFRIENGQTESNEVEIYFENLLIIDSKISSLLRAIFCDEGVFDGTPEQINDRVCTEVIDNDWENVDLMDICELVKHLMIFETGYIRYDYDTERSNGDLHPEKHFDVFYSSGNTLKLGVKESVTTDWMLDMMNIQTDCRYIK